MNKTILSLSAASLMFAACTPAEITGIIRDAANSRPSASPSPAAATAVPADIVAFRARYQKEATNPRGAARMLFEALVNGLERREQAENYLTVVLRSDELTASDKSPTGYTLGPTGTFMLQQIQARPEIVYSYVGGTPDKDYKNWIQTTMPLNIPEQGATVGQIVVDNSVEKPGAATGKLYVSSAGKDSPTPLNMDLNKDGIWKIQISSLGNLATGVKAGTAGQGDF